MNFDRSEPTDRPRAETAVPHKILLFCFGVAATMIEETYALASRLIEQRETAEQAGRKLLGERAKKWQPRRHLTDGAAAEAALRSTSRDDLPTRSDIEALDEQIAHLTREIDAIAKP